MSLLVGFTGYAGCGKSTAANVLVDFKQFKVLSFAEPIKNMAAVLLMNGFGYKHEDALRSIHYKNMVIPELGRTMRLLLQTLGTEWGRDLIKQDIWIESMRGRVAGIWKFKDIVIDDLRFKQESEFIRASGGLVIHLLRPGKWSDGHASESGIEIDSRDVVIVNDGTLEDLKAEVIREVNRFALGSDELIRLCLTPCADYRI